MTVPRSIIDVAQGQGGYVTRTQLIDSGMSGSAIDRRVSTGAFTVVTPALYQLIPSSEHVDLLRGALLALPKPVVVSHESAAHLHGFPILPSLTATVTVASRTTHRFPGVTVRRADDLTDGDITVIDSMPVTNVVRTVFDLAGVLRRDRFHVMVEALVVERRLSIKQLDRTVTQLGRRGKRGTLVAREFVASRTRETDPDATVLERRGRSVLRAAGLPTPVPQYPLPWDRSRRFDDAYPEATLAIEWDSRAWHSQQAAIDSDRRRDRDAALHGWQVIRFTWRDVTERPRQLVAAVGSLLDTRHISRTGQSLRSQPR